MTYSYAKTNMAAWKFSYFRLALEDDYTHMVMYYRIQ